MFETRVFDTVTGEPLLTVHPSSASWSAKLSGSGQGEATIPLRGQGISRDTVRTLIRPNARLIAHVDEHDTVIAAGLMMQPKYDKDTGKVAVAWVDIRTLMRERMGFGVGSWGPSGTLAVTGRNRSGAGRALISRAMRDGAEPTWALPIDLPADGTGSFTRKWEYYGFFTMDDGLREIEGEGVEVYFDPHLDGGNLRFQTRVGNPITGGSFDLPVTADKSRVTKLQVTEDGSKQLTGVIYAGNGTEADTVTAWAGHGPYTIPIRDAYRSAKDVKSVAQLQRMADADLAEHFDPLVQWSFSVRLDDTVRAAHVKPGRLLNMQVDDDEWIEDGMYTQRVIGVSGNLTSTVSLEVQSHG